MYMIQSPELEGVGGVYLNNGIAPGVGKTGHKFEIGEVSEEGRDEVEAAALWKAAMSRRAVQSHDSTRRRKTAREHRSHTHPFCDWL